MAPKKKREEAAIYKTSRQRRQDSSWYKSYYVTAEYRWESGHNLGEKRNYPDVYVIGTKNHWNEMKSEIFTQLS